MRTFRPDTFLQVPCPQQQQLWLSRTLMLAFESKNPRVLWLRCLKNPLVLSSLRIGHSRREKVLKSCLPRAIFCWRLGQSVHTSFFTISNPPNELSNIPSTTRLNVLNTSLFQAEPEATEYRWPLPHIGNVRNRRGPSLIKFHASIPRFCNPAVKPAHAWGGGEGSAWMSCRLPSPCCLFRSRSSPTRMEVTAVYIKSEVLPI